MNQKGRVTGQDEQNQEQKGCRMKENKRTEGRMSRIRSIKGAG